MPYQNLSLSDLLTLHKQITDEYNRRMARIIDKVQFADIVPISDTTNWGQPHHRTVNRTELREGNEEKGMMNDRFTFCDNPIHPLR